LFANYLPPIYQLEDRLYEKDKLLRQTEKSLKESRRQEEELRGQVDALQSTLDALKKTSKETGNAAIANIEVQEQLDQVTQRMLLTRKQLAAAQEASEALQKEFEEELQEQKSVTIRMRAEHAEEIEKYEHYMARLLGSHELLSADLQDMRNEMFEHTQKAKGVERERGKSILSTRWLF
jgi:chromosome segregation ATPase